ncbi:TraU family protein [Pseudomonas sp. GWSMS-1]|uniref:TraU family protein n=1 Tax=Pseudomonas sp. GWSMS-1 TaxID=3308997 RepID=UPI003CF9DB0A
MRAADPTRKGARRRPLCEDSGLLGPKLFTDICWTCLFPIRVAGVQITPGSAPAKASKKTYCICEEGSSGIYKPGIVTAMWEPARIVETVKKPGCSPTLGGVTLPMGSKRSYGRLNQDNHSLTGQHDGSFYHTHLYAFPLLQISISTRRLSATRTDTSIWTSSCSPRLTLPGTIQVWRSSSTRVCRCSKPCGSPGMRC